MTLLTMNNEQARDNMIINQVRADHVLDDRILERIKATSRDFFVADEFKQLAFSETKLPIGHKQVMMTPNEEARLLQAVSPQETDNVLEVGTGSGYVTALLAGLSHHVYTVEHYEDLSNKAKARLEQLAINNVSYFVGDATHGWDQHAPYDVIAITGSLPYLPESFKRSLSIGGRLFAILGKGPAMQATLITHVDEDEWTEKVLFETSVPQLFGATQPEQFKF